MEVSDTNTQPVWVQCTACNSLISREDQFCGYCGDEVAVQETASKEDVFAILQPLLIYYFSTLLLLATYKLTSAFPEGIEGLIIVSVLDIIIVLIFWIYDFQSIKSLFLLSKVKANILGLSITGAIVAGLLVSLLADAINVSIYEDVYYAPYLFEDTLSPLLWAVLITCVLPAIFEEVAFRGFLFHNTQKVTSSSNTVYITSFLFGIIHLSVISLLWLVPIGLAFAFLRHKYNTLWYGIVGHFTYNLTITILEFVS